MNENKVLGKTLDEILKENFIESIKGLKFNKKDEIILVRKTKKSTKSDL